jgi:hypothetical protein
MSDEAVKDSPEGKGEGGEARMEASIVKGKMDQGARGEGNTKTHGKKGNICLKGASSPPGNHREKLQKE